MDGADCRVTLLRHARVARQDIDFARIKSGKALLRVEGNGFVFVGISEGSCSDRTAQVDIEPPPLALVVRSRKTSKTGCHPALQMPAFSNHVQCSGRRLRGNHPAA